MTLLIAMMGFLSAMLITMGLARRSDEIGRNSVLSQRLRDFQEASEDLDEDLFYDTAANLERGQKESFLARFGDQISSSLMNSRGGQGLIDYLDEQMMLAGNPMNMRGNDFVAWYVMIVGGTLMTGLLFVASGIPTPLFAAMMFLAMYYPLYQLKLWVKQRKEQAFAEFPYFLDELIQILSSESATLDRAMREVVLREETSAAALRDSQRVLVREFRRAYREIQNGRDSANAYRAAAARIGVQEVDDFVEVIVEALQRGSEGTLEIFRAMSEHVFTIFEQRMYSLIKEKDSTFTVATVMIMVAVAIVMLEPIVYTVIKALSGGSAL